MSKEERDSHNSKAYRTVLQQISELRPDQGHDAVRLAREMLGMEVERWGCFALRGGPESHCVISSDHSYCTIGNRLLAHGKHKEDCEYWRKY